jgi:hypothetical protein
MTPKAETASELVIGPDGSETRYDYIDATEENVVKLIKDIFENEWRRMTVGPWLRGSLFELTFEKQPDVSVSGGYLTVNPGPWHFHLTVGVPKDTDEETAKDRVTKVAFYQWRSKEDSVKGRSNGIRMWNGHGEQLITFFFPHVLLGEKPNTVGDLNWENLRSFYEFRERYLGEPMPSDLEAAGRAPLAA